MGCALGAVAGNALYLKSAGHMLVACSVTATAVAASLVACRRAVFSPSDAGWLLRKAEPGRWAAVDTPSRSGGGTAAAEEPAAAAPLKAKKATPCPSPATFQRRGTGRDAAPVLSV